MKVPPPPSAARSRPQTPEGTALLPHPTGSLGKLHPLLSFQSCPSRSAQRRDNTTLHGTVCWDSRERVKLVQKTQSRDSLPSIFLKDRDVCQPAPNTGVTFRSVTDKLCWLRFLSDHDQTCPRQKGSPLGIRLIGVQLSSKRGVTFELPEVFPFIFMAQWGRKCHSKLWETLRSVCHPDFPQKLLRGLRSVLQLTEWAHRHTSTHVSVTGGLRKSRVLMEEKTSDTSP